MYSEFYTDRAGRFRWRTRGANHEILGVSSQSYSRKIDRAHAYHLMVRPEIPVRDLDET